MESPDYNYLDSLNPQQRAAVEYCDGPSLVIAGAGSGKTRVLTYKIVHLLRHGLSPDRILALTFTNKAAREMKNRIAPLVGHHTASRLWMGTFHSIFLRMLRRHADRIGFKSGFTIYDAADTKSLIKLIIRELALDDKLYKASAIASTISNAKNAMMTLEQYAANYGDQDRKARRAMTSRIFEMYCQRCKAANAMDFDDILFYTNILLKDNEDVRDYYREQFRYILVDEYQDTNFAQHLIVSQISRPKNMLCVVGDDAQSIYSFRGANISNIISLEKVYPGLQTFKLERNYRSTKNIVNAAGSLISANTRQLHKEVYSENESGSPVEIISTYSDIEEAYVVANRINARKLSEHDSYEDYAVLYRTNAQSRVIEEALRKRNINYRIVGGTAFYQRKEVKDALAYFRLTINPDDDEALRRIINYPARGIGETTLKKLQSAASDADVSMWQILDNPDKYKLPVNSGTMKKLNAFHDMISDFIGDDGKSNAYELGQLIFNRTGILLVLAHDNTPESISRQENLSEMLAGLKEFVDIRLEEGDSNVKMTDFLSEVQLATDQDEKDKDDEKRVTLMTAHAAKGLEFKHVYIVGVEEELFPSSMAMSSLADIEEERRLLYVAITRAKESCVMTYAKSRFRNGQIKMMNPSRFIADINPKYLKFADSDDSPREKRLSPPENIPLHSFHETSAHQHTGTNPIVNAPRPGLRKVSVAAPAGIVAQHTKDELAVGVKIEHGKFGIGIILSLGSISGEDSISVDFGVMGIRKLMLKYARFNILES